MSNVEDPRRIDLPKIVSHAEWLSARKELLIKEKALTRYRDAVNAERRRLPMVKIEKDYIFDGPTGKAQLLDLFGERRQLIVYHFMFDPSWDEGCPSCSFLVDNIGHLAHLHARKTSLAVVSRAPLAKIEPFKRRMGWTFPWYSSFGTDFNYDLHVTLMSGCAPLFAVAKSTANGRLCMSINRCLFIWTAATEQRWTSRRRRKPRRFVCDPVLEMLENDCS